MSVSEEFHQRGHHVQSAHGRRVQLAAEGDHLSGGMIALMPTAADAKRLALKGGEKPEDLHCTLAFLGDDGSAFSEDAQAAVVESVRSMLPHYFSAPITANIFGISHWNAGGPSPSWVWSVGDSQETPRALGMAHSAVTMALEESLTDAVEHPEIPPQHTPWVAHICAAYTGDLTLAKELEKRLGEITFDRVRVSFGAVDVDIPLEAAAVTAGGGVLRRNPKEWEAGVDFVAHQESWQSGVDEVTGQLSGQLDKWYEDIASQAGKIVESGDIVKLREITVDTSDVAGQLADQMRQTAQEAGEAAQKEAEAQGVKVKKWTLAGRKDRLMQRTADAMAQIMGDGLVLSARRHALSLAGSDMSEADVTREVTSHLKSLTESRPREAIGAALTAAQNAGRRAVFEATPPADYYASEMLDRNTCKPCRDLDGYKFPSLDMAYKSYPTGGYRKCLGGGRCRGMVIARWPDAQTASAAFEELVMPWHTVQNHSECTEGQWAVVKDADGSVAGCHDTEQEANDQMAALYAAESSGEMTIEADLGAKPSEGTKKDKRLKENKAAADDLVQAEISVEEAGAEPVTVSGKTAPWRGPLTVEGIETGDGREFDVESLTWAGLPLPLRWNIEDSHGGEARTKAVNVGNITNIWRDGSLVMGEGLLDLGDSNGQRVHDKIAGGFLRGVSVDVDSIKDADVEMVWPAMPEGEGEGDMFDMLFASPEKVIYHAGRIRAATVVDIPAFAEAYIALLDEEGAVVAGGEPIGSLRASKTQRAVFVGPALRASGSGWAPPTSWFQDPKLSVPTGITIDAEGRVYGHAATWGTCHIGQQGVCVTPPHEEDHPYFMTGELVCADDSRVSVGQITVGTGHAPLSYNAHAASDHYDNTGAAVADVTVGNDAHGIWVAGALRPGADSSRVHELRAAGQVSGDWRRIGGALRLVGLLAVNVPGFPVPKLKTAIKAGSQFALVASGIPQLSDVVTEADMDTWAYARVMAIMSRRVHGEE